MIHELSKLQQLAETARSQSWQQYYSDCLKFRMAQRVFGLYEDREKYPKRQRTFRAIKQAIGFEPQEDLRHFLFELKLEASGAIDDDQFWKMPDEGLPLPKEPKRPRRRYEYGLLAVVIVAGGVMAFFRVTPAEALDLVMSIFWCPELYRNPFGECVK